MRTTGKKGDVKKYRIMRNVYLPWELMESKAFWELSGTAVRVFFRFLQKRTWISHKKKKRGRPEFVNGGLAFTYTEAVAFGIPASTFLDVVKKLVKVGFVDVEHQGGGLGRDYSRYAISERWRDYGTDKFILVEKKRSLQAGLDVRSWQAKMKKREGIKKATDNRSCQLQNSAVEEKAHSN